jgi:hypothetical protein
MHEIYRGQYLDAWPQAVFHDAPGFAGDHLELDGAVTLEQSGPDAWEKVFQQHHVTGMAQVNEVVFPHQPSRTLIVADLVFNIRNCPPWWTRLGLRLNGGCYSGLSPSDLFRLVIKDKTGYHASLETVLKWDFDRLNGGHGENVGARARDELAGAMRGCGLLDHGEHEA